MELKKPRELDVGVPLIARILSRAELEAHLTACFPDRRLVLLKSTAKWCGPCQQIQPVLEKLLFKWQQHVPLCLLVFDVDEAPELAEDFKIARLPTFRWLLPETPGLEHWDGELSLVGIAGFTQWFENVLTSFLQLTSAIVA